MVVKAQARSSFWASPETKFCSFIDALDESAENNREDVALTIDTWQKVLVEGYHCFDVEAPLDQDQHQAQRAERSGSRLWSTS